MCSVSYPYFFYDFKIKTQNFLPLFNYFFALLYFFMLRMCIHFSMLCVTILIECTALDHLCFRHCVDLKPWLLLTGFNAVSVCRWFKCLT